MKYVAELEFFKANSKGKLDQIESDASSLHFRRSIIIKDPKSKSLYVIHGNGASKKIQEIANNHAKTMLSELGKKFSIVNTEYDQAKELITKLIGDPQPPTKSTKKKSKPKVLQKKPPGAIPQVPSMGKSSQDGPRPKGDDDAGGPIIQEFQIAYYKDDKKSEEITESASMPLVLGLLSNYINEVNSIMANKPNRNSAISSLQSVSQQIIDLIYK